jgi:hypothetical protein
VNGHPLAVRLRLPLSQSGAGISWLGEPTCAKKRVMYGASHQNFQKWRVFELLYCAALLSFRHHHYYEDSVTFNLTPSRTTTDSTTSTWTCSQTNRLFRPSGKIYIFQLPRRPVLERNDYLTPSGENRALQLPTS